MNVAQPLEPDSPVPIFHQIVEAIRYRIATGQLRPGDRLSPIREAAQDYGVHYLTVRKAYAALEAEGLVTARRGVGTSVVEHSGGIAVPLPDFRSFVDETIRRASVRFGVTPARLAAAIDAASPGSDMVRSFEGPTHVIECTREQAADYADQLTGTLGIPVSPWVLGEEEPPAGPLISTFFHFNDIRSRWPARAPDVQFVAVELDPAIAIPRSENSDGVARRVRVLDMDSGRLHCVLPDLAALLPPERFILETLVPRQIEDVLQDDDPSPILVPPRLRARLGRSDPRFVELRYVIAARDVELLRTQLTGEARVGTRGGT